MSRALKTIAEFQEHWNKNGYVSGRPIRNNKPTNHRFWPKAMCNLGITRQTDFGYFIDLFDESGFSSTEQMVEAIEQEARRLARLSRKGVNLWEM